VHESLNIYESIIMEYSIIGGAPAGRYDLNGSTIGLTPFSDFSCQMR